MTQTEQLNLGNPNESTTDGPVECLGQSFANDAERREHYLAILAEKLKDPEFRKIEGFPIGEDEDILALSDPPFYTACPNPFIQEFIEFYGRPYDPDESYSRLPFASDVQSGKNDPIYNAHPYHTKVPPKAILNYLAHFTVPGDVVLDFTSGTGMTGVAAGLCANSQLMSELSGPVDEGNLGKSLDNVGGRHVLLCDLSPAATWISYGLNRLIDPETMAATFGQLEEICCEIDKNYFIDTSGGEKKLLYLIWSDLLRCPHCANEIVFWDAAVDPQDGVITDRFKCNSCDADLNKGGCEVVVSSSYDEALEKISSHAVRVPVIAVFQSGKRNERYVIPVGERSTYTSIIDYDLSDVPRDRIDLDLDIWWDRDYRKYGIYSIDRFFTNRALAVLKHYKKSVIELGYPFAQMGMWVLTAVLRDCSLMTGLDIKKYFHGGGGPFSGGVKGTFFVPSLSVEKNIAFSIRNRLETLLRVFKHQDLSINSSALITTQSASCLPYIPGNSVDYIFVDPPFGSNFIYSELNMIAEAWLSVKTEDSPEAVVHRRKKSGKGLADYHDLMRSCFLEAFRVLKPGRWMTVEFSNTKASVWNHIQLALFEAGFVVANVSALDKKQGSFKAVTTPTAVKQDLVISAYKPDVRFQYQSATAASGESVWEFVSSHLGYLPVVKKRDGDLISVPERDPRILFDQIVSYFVSNLMDVPISSREFQEGLSERFAERDGMVFLPEQVAEYDKARINSKQLKQLSIFVDDEASAIEWLRQLLNEKPQTYQDMHPKFIGELSGWKKAEEQLELSKLLEQSFLKYDDTGPIPPQLHSYLSSNYKELRNLAKDDSQLVNKAKDRWYVPNPDREEDLQKLRERDLLKQFSEYKGHTGRKLKTVRMEAVRCGFKKAWQDRDYATIISVAEKIPQNLLQEDQKLLMWYDQAQTRSSDESLD